MGRASRRIGAVAAASFAALLSCVALSACGSSSSSASSAGSLGVGTAYPNGNLSSTRYWGGPIDAANVAKLEVAWTMPITAKSEYGSYSAAPVVSHGVVYSQDLASNVEAISLETGKLIWSRSFAQPDQGPNGVVVANGRVFGATSEAAFALDAKTGKELWSVPLTRNAHEGIDMAPGYHQGIVYVSTVPGNANQFYKGEGVGIMWALDAATGSKLWHFDTAPEDLWAPSNVSINSGGGLWYTPSFDEHGYMYIGTGNPAPFPGTTQFPWGSSRPGPDLYTDSIVKLNATTGKLAWYYQLTPHDLYDWDLQDPPILTTVHGKQAVIGAGKSGIVVALSASTGRPLWKRAVGIHNGHDNDHTYALKREFAKLKLPETVYPGLLGGVIAPMASNGQSVFVPVVNHSVTISSQGETQEPGGSTGEVVAIDVQTGALRWRRSFPSPAFGAVTAVNDLVLATSFSGMLYALDAATGAIAWQIQLPAGTNTGVSVEGDTVIAPAGAPVAEGQAPEITAYRLPK